MSPTSVSRRGRSSTCNTRAKHTYKPDIAEIATRCSNKQQYLKGTAAQCTATLNQKLMNHIVTPARRISPQDRDEQETLKQGIIKPAKSRRKGYQLQPAEQPHQAIRCPAFRILLI